MQRRLDQVRESIVRSHRGRLFIDVVGYLGRLVKFQIVRGILKVAQVDARGRFGQTGERRFVVVSPLGALLAGLVRARRICRWRSVFWRSIYLGDAVQFGAYKAGRLNGRRGGRRGVGRACEKVRVGRVACGQISRAQIGRTSAGQARRRWRDGVRRLSGHRTRRQIGR